MKNEAEITTLENTSKFTECKIWKTFLILLFSVTKECIEIKNRKLIIKSLYKCFRQEKCA